MLYSVHKPEPRFGRHDFKKDLYYADLKKNCKFGLWQILINPNSDFSSDGWHVLISYNFLEFCM